MGRLKQCFGPVFCGLRSRLLVPVGLACIPLVLLTIHEALDERRTARELWVERAEKLAQVVEREERSVVGSTRQFLAAVAESSPVEARNQRAAQKLLEHLSSSYERYSCLALLSTNGEVLATAGRLPPTPGRDACFDTALKTGDFAAQWVPNSGEASRSLSFAQPVYDESGTMQGVVFAGLDLERLERVTSEILDHLPKGAFWFQLDQSGTVFAKFSRASRQFQSRYPEFTRELYGSKSQFVETSQAGLEDVALASAPMQSYLAGQMVVGVLGTQRKLLFAHADETLSQNLVWVGIATILALSIGWFGSNLLVLEPIRALARSSARLANGDLAARTGLKHSGDELGELTQAFDRMAQNLEHREQESRSVNRKLQVLSRKLVEVQESERRAIARELHDEVGQSLTAAQLGVQAALQSDGTPSVRHRLVASSDMLQRVIEQVHDLSLNLRPSMLDDLGLEAALRWYVLRQSTSAGLHAEFIADPLSGRLDPVIETECFRIAQEALTNIIRHSGAKEFRVELGQRDGELRLSVQDNGMGFDVQTKREQAVRGSSLGLLSMAERASLAGGRLEIHSRPGQGTRLEASFPIKLKLEDK